MTYDQERARQTPPRRQVPGRRDPRGPAPAPRPAPAQEPGEPLISAEALLQTPTSEHLLPQDVRDKLTLQLQQCLSTFVESPRQAVEQADSAFAEATTHLAATLEERRHALGASWQGQGTDAQTDELRRALHQYRALTVRLLRM
ncbi:hypothetical protein ACFY04_39295 [Streptomyces sp. NPDC001549]|uniref:hypothetical protein n=1 Tax=Streptomyces sp. NPDC001549 TaxID=3364586 RepID=UPI0036787536